MPRGAPTAMLPAGFLVSLDSMALTSHAQHLIQHTQTGAGKSPLLLRLNGDGELLNILPEIVECRGLVLGPFLNLPERPAYIHELLIDTLERCTLSTVLSLERRALLAVQRDGCGFGRSDPIRHDPVQGYPAGSEYPQYRQQNW